VSAQNKPSGPFTKGEIKTNQTTIVPLRIIGIPKTPSNKDQLFLPTTIAPHKEIHHTATIPNITHQTHHDGCKIHLSQWILAILEPLTVEGEEEETSEEEANTTTNLPIASKAMPQTQETPQMLVSNVGK